MTDQETLKRRGRKRTIPADAQVVTTPMDRPLLTNLDAMAKATTEGNRNMLIRKILRDVTSAWLLAQGK